MSSRRYGGGSSGGISVYPNFLFLLSQIGNMLFAIVAYVKEPPRKVVQCMFLAHIVATGLAAFICWNFTAGKPPQYYILAAFIQSC